jgi:hypothetical protein
MNNDIEDKMKANVAKIKLTKAFTVLPKKKQEND